MDVETVKIVDDLRTKERPVKSFSAMACKLIKRGASFYRIPEEKKKEVIKERVGGVEEVSDIAEEMQSKPMETGKEPISEPKKKQDETKVKPKFCDFCGSDLPSTVGKFCDKCGRKLI
jgi:hypothetical protein